MNPAGEIADGFAVVPDGGVPIGAESGLVHVAGESLTVGDEGVVSVAPVAVDLAAKGGILLLSRQPSDSFAA